MGRTTFVVLALLVTLPLSLYRMWMIRLAVSPEKNLQAHYERMGRLRQQMQTRQRELGENPPDHG